MYDFDMLGLQPALTKALTRAGLSEPTPIQNQAILQKTIYEHFPQLHLFPMISILLKVRRLTGGTSWIKALFISIRHTGRY